MTHWQRISTILNKYQIWLILTLGLIVGLVFVFMVPPWMHYDEPGHFEYAWLIANRTGLPERGDYDQGMRREISASMIEHNLETYTGMTSNPILVDQPIEIFLPQVEDHPPTYYLIAALPLRLFRHSDINFQLHLVRMVSLAMFLVLIWVSHRICRELFNEGNPIIWMVPLFLVTLPSFVDIMTAANNDAAANLAFALFVWASVVLIKKGFSPLHFAALIGSLFLCAFTKSTALLAIPLSLFVILLALMRGKKAEKYVWIALGASAVAAIAMIFVWRESAPAYFYGIDIHTNPHSITTDVAPVGDSVIVQGMQDGKGRPFYHLLSADEREPLSDKSATLGAWIWADAPTTIRFPYIREGQIWIPNLSSVNTESEERIRLPFVSDRQVAEPVTMTFSTEILELTTEPQFFAFSMPLPSMEGNISWLTFQPGSESGVQVYWDGIVLVEGDLTSGGEPEFDDPEGKSITWQGSRFTNLIQNASGENEWPVFSEWVSKILDIPNRSIPSPSLILSIFDTRATSTYFLLSAERIFRTFWAVFGWANVPLFGQKPYRFFLVLSLVYAIGMIIALIRKHYRLPSQIIAFFGIAILAQVFITGMRGVGSWFSTTYIPVGRYLYPVIVPIAIFIVGGIDQLLRLVHKLTRTLVPVLYSLFVSLQLGIMVSAIFSMVIFYSQ